MRTSQLIEALEQNMATYGDREIKLSQYEATKEGEDAELVGLTNIKTEEGTYVLLCEGSTWDLTGPVEDAKPLHVV